MNPSDGIPILCSPELLESRKTLTPLVAVISQSLKCNRRDNMEPGVHVNHTDNINSRHCPPCHIPHTSPSFNTTPYICSFFIQSVRRTRARHHLCSLLSASYRIYSVHLKISYENLLNDVIAGQNDPI